MPDIRIDQPAFETACALVTALSGSDRELALAALDILEEIADGVTDGLAVDAESRPILEANLDRLVKVLHALGRLAVDSTELTARLGADLHRTFEQTPHLVALLNLGPTTGDAARQQLYAVTRTYLFPTPAS